MTSERSRFIDFTVPFYFSGIVMVTKKENNMDNLFSFITIFEWKVWLLIISTIILTGIILFIYDNFNYFSLKNESDNKSLQLKEFIWKAFGVFALGHLSGVNEKTLRSIGNKILIFGFYVFCFICIIFYQANLAVFLTVSRLNSPINSIYDLLEAGDIKYNLVSSTSTQAFFEDMMEIEDDFYDYWVNTSLNRNENSTIENEFFWEYPLGNKNLV